MAEGELTRAVWDFAPYGTSRSLSALRSEPIPQSRRRQTLQVAGEHRHVVRQHQYADDHQERAGDAIDPDQLRSKALKESDESVDCDGGEDEGNRETERVRAEQHQATP